MAAGLKNITIEKGATFRFRFFVKSGGPAAGQTLTLDEAEALPAYDLTDFIGAGAVRETASSRDAIVEFECTIVTAIDGEVELVIDFDDTVDLPEGVYHWDFFVTHATIGRIRLMYGRAEIVGSFTPPD